MRTVVDAEGWLHTGDKGTIDRDGYVKLVGRLKEMFKTSTGEYVVPVPIEQELSRAPLIDWAMVIADKRKFASALLFPNFELLATLKKQQNVTEMSDAEFLECPLVKEQMHQLLAKVNSDLNHWEQIRAYKFIPYALSIEKGELTPSMKLRREVVETKFANEIQQMYPGSLISPWKIESQLLKELALHFAKREVCSKTSKLIIWQRSLSLKLLPAAASNLIR